MRYGGAPEPSFNVKNDLRELAEHFESSTPITKFYSNPSKEARNEFIVGRLTLMNLRYLQFIRKLTSERQLLDSATGITLLGLGLAGSAVPYAQTKTILAAIAAGVAGSKEVIDKNYYFEKTIPALVAQMNAERKKALVPILTGIRSNLDEYPFAQAVTDLHNYYHAGTFAGAIQGIQAEAATTEKHQDEIIATLKPLTKEQRKRKELLTKALGELDKKSDAEKKNYLDKIKAAIRLLDPKVTPADTFPAALAQLQGFVRRTHGDPTLVEKVAKAFEDSGIPIPAE